METSNKPLPQGTSNMLRPPSATIAQEPPVEGGWHLNGNYPLFVAYDGHALVIPDGGTGKGAQLRNLLDGFGSTFVGLAPLSRTGKSVYAESGGLSVRLLQRGREKYLIWQQTSLPKMLAELKPDVFLAPYNTAPLRIPEGTKLITVVHDLILMENLPDSTLRQRMIDFYRARLLHSAINRSSLILTVSNFTANHIRQRYPQVNARVITCTVGHSWFVRGGVVPVSQRKPYILIVTNFRAHKNAPRAMEAFARYLALGPKSTVQLRMVGVSHESGMARTLMKRFQLPADSVFIEPFLSEADLQQRYRHAACVIVPSQMEGFGIPALEAMASGTPLLCSNTWSLPEVGGDAPIYFDPTDTEQMAQALFRVCTESTLRARLSERSLARAEIFHPDRVQAQVMEFWRELPDLCRSWTV